MVGYVGCDEDWRGAFEMRLDWVRGAFDVRLKHEFAQGGRGLSIASPGPL